MLHEPVEAFRSINSNFGPYFNAVCPEEMESRFPRRMKAHSVCVLTGSVTAKSRRAWHELIDFDGLQLLLLRTQVHGQHFNTAEQSSWRCFNEQGKLTAAGRCLKRGEAQSSPRASTPPKSEAKGCGFELSRNFSFPTQRNRGSIPLLIGNGLGIFRLKTTSVHCLGCWGQLH